MTDSDFMAKWFVNVTKPQSANYNRRMADAAPYRNSPRWSREREFASRHFQYETCESRQLYERAMADLEAFGEVTEETDELLTAFQKQAVVTEIMQAAE